MIKKQKGNKTFVILLVVQILLFQMIYPLSTFCADPQTEKLTAELNSTVVQELDEIDFEQLDVVVEEFEKGRTNIFSINNIKEKVYSIISGENALNYGNVLACIFSNLIESVIKYLPMLSVIIAIGVISNLMNGIKSKFNEKSTADLIHIVFFMAVVVLVVGMMSSLASITSNSIQSMTNQMNVLFPILLTIMVAVGAGASAGVFQPVVAIISTYVADIFSYFIFPLFMLSFVFDIISNFSSSVKLDKFSSFISSLFKWAVGISFTLFFAIMSIQGISAGSFDSVSLRTTKYTIKSYVPVMGGYLSDGMDLIMSSSILIKNSVGLVGALLVLNTILSPMLEIVVCGLMLKLCSAILQPLGSGKISNFLTSCSKTLTILSTCVIAVGFMYLVSIGLVMTSSNMVL